MKSRLAMMAMLVSGLLLSGTGATLAVSGSTDNASQAQYGTPTPTATPPATQQAQPPAGGTLPETTEGNVKGETNNAPASKPESSTKPGTSPAPREQGAAPAAQPAAQQAASGGDELPFTGFAAVPILLGGIALMGGGLVMRRRTAA